MKAWDISQNILAICGGEMTKTNFIDILQSDRTLDILRQNKKNIDVKSADQNLSTLVDSLDRGYVSLEDLNFEMVQKLRIYFDENN